MKKQLPWVLAAIALAACGGTTSGGPGQASSSGGSSGSSGGSSGTTSSGGSSGNNVILPTGALDGTWDVILTNPKTGRETTGTITLGPALFAMSFNDFELNGAVNNGVPDVTTKYRGDTRKLGTTLSQNAFDTGSFSVPLGGEWVIKGDSTDACTANIKIPTSSLECDGMPTELRKGIEGTSSAQRISTLPSSFGELGGKWTVLVPGGTCEATFEGSNLTAKCTASWVSCCTRGISTSR